MGAHHAPAHVARRSRPAHASSTETGPRLGRLAGRGVLTASAALAMTGAGAGAALAQDAQPVGGLLADDSSLLCGILGGDRCSSDTESSPDSDDASRSVFDRLEERGDATGDGSVGGSSSRATDTTDDSSVRSSSARDDGASRSAASQQQARQQSAQQQAAQQQSAQPQSSQLDTPPPPGEVRAINLPN